MAIWSLCPNIGRYVLGLNALHVDHKARTTNLFQQLFPKREDLSFRERIHLPVSEDTKFKLLLCMSLVFGASRNVSFNDDNHILKFFTEGFENLLSRFFFFNSENLLSSIEQCMRRHLYFPFGKFHLDIHNKMADNNGTAFPHETDFNIIKDRFCWIDIFITWFGDHQLPYQFVRLLLMVEICSACKCNYLQTWLSVL